MLFLALLVYTVGTAILLSLALEVNQMTKRTTTSAGTAESLHPYGGEVGVQVTPIMDPDYQLPEHAKRTMTLPGGTTITVPNVDLSNVDVSTAAPLAALGIGLAGAAAYLLTHRKKETLRDRISGFIGDTVDEGSDLAHKAYLEAEDFMKHEGRAATKEAKKRGRKLFNLGRAAAEKAYSEASDYAEHEGRDAAEQAMKRGRKLFERGSDIAQKRLKEGRKVAEDVSDYAQHEGRKKAKRFFARTEKTAKRSLEKGRKATENALDKWAERYPLLTGLLVAALLDQSQKYFQKNA